MSVDAFDAQRYGKRSVSWKFPTMRAHLVEYLIIPTCNRTHRLPVDKFAKKKSFTLRDKRIMCGRECWSALCADEPADHTPVH